MSIAQGYKADLSKVKWSRHADGRTISAVVTTLSDESESPDTEEAEATNTPAARCGSGLPVLPIAGGVAVLVVLLAVIVLETKKWKNSKN
ncbi:MAG: hypothetical protein NC489_41075 [Ruminococcus flavefaciens]|nr:hypothetical protein [Ruminococcus flavefaciens]